MTFEGRIIWVFREPRSGSTWLTQFLADSLNREFKFVDYPTIYEEEDVEFFQEPNDENRILNTHDFKILSSMKNYNNPILIRCYRKDVIEQFLSSIAVQLTKIYNISRNEDRTLFQERIENLKIELTKTHFEEYMKFKNKWEEQWETYSVNYENYSFSYEDLVSGCELFNFGKILMNNYTEKLPKDYKDMMFLNYNDMKNWL